MEKIGRSAQQLSPRMRSRLLSAAVAVLRAALLIAVGYAVLSPLLQMLSNSLKSPTDFLNTSVVWLPSSLYVKNFTDAILALDYWKTLLYTLAVPVLCALLSVAVCSVTAYGFSRFHFPERKLLFILLLLTILVPSRLTMLPSYVEFRQFDFFGLLGLIGRLTGKDLTINLIDTPFTMYLPTLFSIGYRSGIFILIFRQFFNGLPKELEEAAWIDGAGPLRTFGRIIIPSSGVAFLTVTILAVIWFWNEDYMSGIYMTTKFPLAVAMARIKDLIKLQSAAGADNELGIVMAGCVLFILPVLILYLILQKRFIKSIDRVGIVG